MLKKYEGSINEIFNMAGVDGIKIVREKYNDRYITLHTTISERRTLKNKGVKEVYSLILLTSSRISSRER